MSVSSKGTSGVSAEEKSGKSLEHTPSKPKSASLSSTRKNESGYMANGNLPDSDSPPIVSMRERTSSLEQRKQGASSSTKSSKSRTEALLSRKVTGSATSVRTPGSVTSRPPMGKGPRKSTSSDKVQIGPENGYTSGQTLDQSVSQTASAPPKREGSSASSCSSSEGEEKGLKITTSHKPPSRRSGVVEENGKKVSGGGPGSQTGKSNSNSKSKTPPTVRRKSSPPSSENNSRFQRQSSLKSSRNGTTQPTGRKLSSRTPSNSSLDSGLSPTKLTESESRKLRNGTTKSSSEDSISDTERKTKSALSRTPSTKRKVCMEIVMEKKVISTSNGTASVKTESSIGKSPSKHSLSSPTDECANSTRTSPTKSKSATTLKPSLLGTQTGARRKIRTASSNGDQKSNGACSSDKSRTVSAPVIRKTENTLPIISPYAPVRAKSGSVRSTDPKLNLKSPDRSRIMSKIITLPHSRIRTRSMEPVARSVPVAPVKVVDSASSTVPAPSSENTNTSTTITVIHSRRSQSVERRSNKDSFVASRRQAWEDKASESPVDTAKKGLVSPEKRFQRSGVGRRSLIDERKAMLFGGSPSTKGQVKDPEVLKKPAIPAKPANIGAKPPALRGDHRGDHRGQIELHINEEPPPSPKPASSFDSPTSDVAKPAVLQENVQNIQPNAINMMPNKLPSSTDEVDSTRRYSPSKENEIIGMPNDKMYNQKMPVIDNHEYGDTLEKWSMLKENQSINELGKKQDSRSLDNKEAESRRQALVEYSNRELESSYNKQISEPNPTQDCPPEAKDGHYYHRIVNEEQARIESLCTPANKDMEKELPEEACGKLRASIGKASLLTNKKFKQFRRLCEQNINPVEGEALSVTNLDLTGFWEMVLIQVDDVNSMFAEIEELRHNGWKTPKQSPQKLKTLTKRPSSLTSPPPSPGIYKSSANPLAMVDPKVKAEREKKAAKARQARDEARKRLLAAKKAAARKRVKSEDGEPQVPVEIFTPDKS